MSQGNSWSGVRSQAVLPLLVVFALLSAAMTVRGDCGPMHTPGVESCQELFFETYLDQFSWRNETFKMRYFLNSDYYRSTGPIFFYTGNEADVEQYVNCTGLMWESAEKMGAALVFAEHRFYGKSMPCGDDSLHQCGDVFSPEQAMADYAALIRHLQENEFSDSGATFAFGGSYGGMLAAWMRMRYPGLVYGAVAASAPIECTSKSYDLQSFWKYTTYDATSDAGSHPDCRANVSTAFSDMQELLQSEDGRQLIQSKLHLCDVPDDTEESRNHVLEYVQGAFAVMAMGNYPFETYYICGSPSKPCPAWPVRVACDHMGETIHGRDHREEQANRLEKLHLAISVAFNATEDRECYNISGEEKSMSQDEWDFLLCTSSVIYGGDFPSQGEPKDMFYEQEPFDEKKFDQQCRERFDKVPRRGFLDAALGPKSVKASSNIIFSNGDFDPWASGGIYYEEDDEQANERDLVTLVLKEGAHHLDFFFSTPDDPEELTRIRDQERDYLMKWLKEAQHEKRLNKEKVIIH